MCRSALHRCPDIGGAHLRKVSISSNAKIQPFFRLSHNRSLLIHKFHRVAAVAGYPHLRYNLPSAIQRLICPIVICSYPRGPEVRTSGWPDALVCPDYTARTLQPGGDCTSGSSLSQSSPAGSASEMQSHDPTAEYDIFDGRFGQSALFL